MINLSPGFVGIGEVFDRVGGKLGVKLSQVKLIKKTDTKEVHGNFRNKDMAEK